MKGKLLYVIIAIVIHIFFKGFNSNIMLHKTQDMSQLEKVFKAERNKNTELRIERDDLFSGRHIASLVPQEMSKFVSKEKAQNVIYISEPEQQKTPTYYAIIDLLTSKAEATTAIQPD